MHISQISANNHPKTFFTPTCFEPHPITLLKNLYILSNQPISPLTNSAFHKPFLKNLYILSNQPISPLTNSAFHKPFLCNFLPVELAIWYQQIIKNILEISHPCFFLYFHRSSISKHLRVNCRPYNNLSCHIQTPRDITVPGTHIYIYSPMCAITQRPISSHCPMNKGNWYIMSSFPGPRSGFNTLLQHFWVFSKQINVEQKRTRS